MTNEPNPNTEQLIEQAHLAMIRHMPDQARSYLQQALAADPGNVDAQRMIGQLSQTRLPAATMPLYDPGYGTSPDDLYATALAQQAAADERLRLGGSQYGFGGSSFGSPWSGMGDAGRSAAPLWFNIVKAVVCIGLATAFSFMPTYSRYSHYASPSLGQELHMGILGNLLIGVGLGLAMAFTPWTGRSSRWW